MFAAARPRSAPAELSKAVPWDRGPESTATQGDELAVRGQSRLTAIAPIAPARLGMLYLDDVDAAVRSLDLREVDEGANVLIAEPFDPVVYERVSTRDHLTVAAPTQVAADLLTGPGRMPSEGEELIAWMNGNERAWRS